MLSDNMTVAVMVSDAKKSAEWYKQKLGFESSIEGHWVTTWRAGTHWKIHLCEGDLEPGNTGIAFYADDVKKAADELKEKGVKFSMDYANTEWGEMAVFDDPDGNSFTIKKGSA